MTVLLLGLMFIVLMGVIGHYVGGVIDAVLESLYPEEAARGRHVKS